MEGRIAMGIDSTARDHARKNSGTERTLTFRGLPAENIYGHTAKLHFFLDAVERTRRDHDRGLRILDIGCGNGWAVTRYLAADGDHVLGIDVHPDCIAYAQTHFGHNGLDFKCLSAESLQEQPARWDVIVLADVLEHLDDPALVLHTCTRLLACDGRILVSVPNGYGPFELESAFSRAPVIGSALLKLTDLTVAVMNKFVFKGLWTRAIEELPKDIPYNSESPHVQFRSEQNWKRLFDAEHLVIKQRCNLALVCGPFSNYLFGASKNLVAANVWAARHMATRFVSNWAFELAYVPERSTGTCQPETALATIGDTCISGDSRDRPVSPARRS